jgi:hypothetical protein
VFYVTPTSTLAHTVAKMVATTSHRSVLFSFSFAFFTDWYSLWMTDPQSPSSSIPATPPASSAHFPINAPTDSHSHAIQNAVAQTNAATNHAPDNRSTPPPSYTYPHHPVPPQVYQSPSPGLPPTIAPAVPAAALPGARLSGHLVGVVSLTDILFLYARASGLSPNDPAEARSHRRRSSSSSLSIRKSGDIGRELFRGGQ